MLCLADRGFFSYGAWKEALGSGAALFWRAKAGRCLQEERRLKDESYRTTLHADEDHRRHQRQGLTVRVIQYRLEGVDGAEPVYRLVTSILDPKQVPVGELAESCHHSWEVETALDEVKSHLRGARIVLRSKTPDLVKQGFYGLMMAHFAVRGLMHEAALRTTSTPTTFPSPTPSAWSAADSHSTWLPPRRRPRFHQAPFDEILSRRVSPSRGHCTLGGAKRKISNYPIRRSDLASQAHQVVKLGIRVIK